MPWNVKYGYEKRTEREFLKFPAGLDAIKSVVLKASEVAELPSNDPDGYGGRRVLKKGQLLTKIPGPGDTTKYRAYSAQVGETPAGVLGNDVEFLDDSTGSDEAADMYYHGCVFKSSKLIGFTGNEAAVRTALDTSKFE